MDEEYSGALGMARRLQEIVLFALMLIITALVFIQVILRYVLRAPLMGIEEMLFFPTVWLYMLGAVNASSQRTQIVCRIAEVFTKNPKTVFLVRTIGTVISVIVVCWLTYWGYDYLKYAIRVSRTSPTLYIPLIYAESAVFICLLLITFYTVLEMRFNYLLFRNPPEDMEKYTPEEK